MGLPPWFITGATDGIGLALAQRCQQLGEPTILLGRRPLAELPPEWFTEANYICVDLAEPMFATHVLAWLETHGVDRLRGLIHNAAVGWVGDLSEQSATSVQEITQVNLGAPIFLTSTLAARTDRVVFISSVVAEWGAARYGVYAASKAALNGWSRSWRAENPDCLVQTLHLGAVRTGLHRKCGWDVPAGMFAKFPPPENAATWIHQQLQGRKTQATMGLTNGLVRWAGELAKFPRAGRHSSRPPRTRVPHVLITGASQGIGAALVAEFTGRGCLVTGVDVAPADGEILPLDLAQPATWDALWPELSDRPAISLVIHNAGISATGAFTKITADLQARVVAVNFTAPMTLNAELCRRNLVCADVDFVLVSSLSVYSGYPGASIYAATKAGLAAYGKSLRAARQPHGGRVLTVFPGPVRTTHAREHSPDNRYEHKRMDPAVLAAAIHQAWERGSKILVPGVGNKISALLGWGFPRLMTALMRQLLFKKMR